MASTDDEPPGGGPADTNKRTPLGFSSGEDSSVQSKQRRAALEAQGRQYTGGSLDAYAINQGVGATSNIQQRNMQDLGRSGVPKRVLYYAGDEYKPSQSPQNVPWLQKQLIAAGLLDPDDVRPGLWDSNAAKAYREVLAIANRQGVSAAEALAQLAQNPPLGGLDGGKEAPVIQVTSPEELRESFRQTYNSRVGKDPPQSAMDAFVSQYHAIEQGAQQAYNDGAPGATVTQAPSAQTHAEEVIRQQFKAEEQAYATIQRENDFFNMLGPIGGGAPA